MGAIIPGARVAGVHVVQHQGGGTMDESQQNASEYTESATKQPHTSKWMEGKNELRTSSMVRDRQGSTRLNLEFFCGYSWRSLTRCIHHGEAAAAAGWGAEGSGSPPVRPITNLTLKA